MNRDELRGEAELAFLESRSTQDLGNVAVIQNRIGRKVLGDLAKAGLERGFASRAANAAFCVADDSEFARDCARFDQRLNRQIRSGRIAARIRDQPRACHAASAEFGQSVNRFGEKFGLGVRLLIPALIIFHGPQSKRSAQVDDLGARIEHRSGQFH